MPFCEECGNEIRDGAKFCPNCGTKTKEIAKIVKKKIKKKPEPKVQISPPQEKQTAIDIDEKDTEYLKEFFTKPSVPSPAVEKRTMDPRAGVPFLWGISLLFFMFAYDELEYWTLCGGFSYATETWSEHCYESGQVWRGEFGFFFHIMTFFGCICILLSILLYRWAMSVGTVEMGKWRYYSDTETSSSDIDSIHTAANPLKEWEQMSPEPLFRRLDQAQKIVADSSFEGLGINKSAKPSEGGVIRTPAYSYGPHLDFTDLIFGKVDKDGIGKGAGYYKICDDSIDGGLYTREYDMMVIQFTKNQILVYKCIFDILEMTKRLEESYEWNYKHVVGINISGDDKEKKLGASISVTGTKYMVISAASGDKIEIILGAETNELVDGKKKKSHLGGEDKIFEIANAAVKNVREAIREKAG
jgi:hypothetical protein